MPCFRKPPSLGVLEGLPSRPAERMLHAPSQTIFPSPARYGGCCTGSLKRVQQSTTRSSHAASSIVSR
eukprot:9286879-Alexandrium_andersonii.AAC.1